MSEVREKREDEGDAQATYRGMQIEAMSQSSAYMIGSRQSGNRTITMFGNFYTVVTYV